MSDLTNIKNNVLRNKILYAMFIGYIFFYFSRKSLTIMTPLMINDLKISIYEFGFINSIFYIIYAISKFICGVISDKSNSRYLMFIALILTGIFNIFIGFSSNIIIIAFFWTCNAFFQGWGWPPITKQLTYWYTKQERGLWWGILSISHNIGGAIIPVVIGFLSLYFSWKVNFYFIGMSCIFIGVYLINSLHKLVCTADVVNYEIINTSVKGIFLNKNIIFLSASYFLIYLIKTCINDWTILYMVNQKEHTLFSAGIGIFCFESGGMLGIVAAGWITDKIVKNRVIFLLFCINWLFIISVVFYNIPTGYKIFEYIIIFIFGFFVFAPQMLIGLIASEIVSRENACTANSFVGTFAYVGASLAGYPVSLIINLSWNIYFMMIVCCEIILIPILIMLFINNR